MKRQSFTRRFLTGLLFALTAAFSACQVNTWVPKAHMIAARQSFASATGADGRIYVFGGVADAGFHESLTSAEVYDPATNTWSSIASLPNARWFSRAVTNTDGRIYIAGGNVVGGTSDNVIAYDPTSNTYSDVASLPAAIPLPSAYMGNDGNMYVVDADHNTFYRYTLGTNSWTAIDVSGLSSFFSGPAVTVGPDGLAYFAAGEAVSDNFQAYNSSADMLTQPHNFVLKRSLSCMATAGDNLVYLIGGYDGSNFQNWVDTFDPVANAWTSAPGLILARARSQAAEDSVGRIYAIGGENSSGVLDSVECFQPSLIKGVGVKFQAQEGQEYNDVIATFTDLNTGQGAGDFSATVSWGDGVNTSATIVAGNAPGAFNIVGDHTYVDGGGFPVQINLQDVDGEAVNITSHVTVADAPLFGTANNITPSVNILFSGAVATMTDGNPLATAADYTATVDWGDGSTSTPTFVDNGTGHFSINGSHTYTTQGSFQVKVNVTDTDGSKLSLTGSANVVIPPPHVTGKTINVVEGAAFNGLVGSFTDDSPNVAATAFTASINWGDGTTTTGTIANNVSGGFDVSGTHVYAEEGIYTVTVSVTPTGGSASSAGGTAYVADASLTATGYSLISKTLNFSDTVATFIDADPLGAAGDFTAGIVWGDGKSSNGTVVAFGSGWKVVGSHSYLKKGKYVVTVHIKDAGGATASATTNVNVGPVK